MKCIDSKLFNFFMLFKRFLFWNLYYLLARHLPGNYTPYGFMSKTIREITCKHIFKKFGNNVDIGNKVVFFNSKYSEIGSNSGIGAWSEIGTVKIGNYVMMGTHCLLISQNHRFEDCNIPICQQGFQKDQPIVIEDNVWIGSRVIILPGVIVSKGAIIGAGSVVTNHVQPYTIVCGNPAKVVRKRYEEKS